MTSTDRLSDFKLGIGIVLKADRDWHDVGRPSSCNAFAIATLSSLMYLESRDVSGALQMSFSSCNGASQIP